MATEGVKKGDWILLTGASGFVAAHILSNLLDGGYKVKCTVRSEDKAEAIRKLRPDHVKDLAFSIVPDVCVDGAHDEAVKGVTGVIHTASPFFFGTDKVKEDLLDPAIKGTKGVLESIHKYGSDVRRVIITSSFAAMVDLAQGYRPSHTYSEKDWNPVTYEEAAAGNGVIAYCASKKLAEKAGWEFLKEKSPKFTISSICPPMVFGPHVNHVTSLKALNTSSADIYRLINGSEKEVPATPFCVWVDARDVGVAHVLALERPGKPHGEEDRFFIVHGKYSYKEICTIIKKHFPELVASGKTPDPTNAPDLPETYLCDNSKSKNELGIHYHSLEECIVDTVKYLLDLEKKLGTA